jgi:hypothetical protein
LGNGSRRGMRSAARMLTSNRFTESDIRSIDQASVFMLATNS